MDIIIVKNGGTDSLKGTLCALFLRGVVDMDFKIGDKLEVEIIDLSNEGTGIGKCQGFTFFVEGCTLGDKVLFEITKLKRIMD